MCQLVYNPYFNRKIALRGDFFVKKSQLLPLIFRLSPKKNVKFLHMSEKMRNFAR